MKIKKFLTITLCVIFCLSLVACKKKKNPPTPDPVVCTQHVDANKDGKCDKCGESVPVTPEVCTEHVDANKDGKCDKCGEDLGTAPCTEHVDANKDGKCDKCGEDMGTEPCTEHVDANKDGKCDKCGEDMGTEPCTEHVDANKDGKCDKCGEDVPVGPAKVYAPKWDLNAIGFNGDGMRVLIKVNPVSEFDPFDADFTGTSQDIKQRHQRMVEAAYKVKIVYSTWDEAAPWGPERVTFINNSFVDGSFQENDVYAVNIASSWIPTIVKSGALASLGTLRQNVVSSGILFDYNPDGDKYEQDKTINATTSASGSVYGLAPGKPHPDNFIYYNVDLAKQAKVEDPAELWMKGEWTMSKFKEWVAAAQTNLPENKYALDMGFAEFTIALVGSTGNQFAYIKPARIAMLEDGVVSAVETVQSLWKQGYYNPQRGTQDVTDQFLNGETILHSGDLWFINASNRFDPARIQFTLGVVPYPAADDDTITPITELTSENGIPLGSEGTEFLTKDGQYITGLDLSSANFQIPFTDTSCYGVLDFNNGKNGINAEVVANILMDLICGLGDDPNVTAQLTDSQAYRLYLEGLFSREIDVEVVMSVQDKTYYEIFNAVSMTVGGGSHFGPNAYWPLCGSICKTDTDVYVSFSEVYEVYRQAMTDMGYIPL